MGLVILLVLDLFAGVVGSDLIAFVVMPLLGLGGLVVWVWLLMSFSSMLQGLVFELVPVTYFGFTVMRVLLV